MSYKFFTGSVVAGGDLILTDGTLSSSGDFKASALNVNNGQVLLNSNGTVSSVGAISSSAAVTGSGLVVKTTGGAVIMEVKSAANTISSSAATSIKSLNVNNGRATTADTGNTVIAGTVQFSGITADTAVTVADDGLLFNDGRDGTVKSVNIGSFCTDIAGAGLTVSSNQLVAASNAVALATDNCTLALGYNYFTGTVDANCSLPGTANAGDVIILKDIGPLAAGKKIEINRSGSHTIDGQTSIDMQAPYGSITFVYLKSNTWGIV